MRVEKKTYESTCFNETGEKETKLTNDAEIVLSIEEALEILKCISISPTPNKAVLDLYDTIKEAIQIRKA